MSESRVCCNCRHNVRINDEKYGVRCYCEIKEKYMGYLEVMDGAEDGQKINHGR